MAKCKFRNANSKLVYAALRLGLFALCLVAAVATVHAGSAVGAETAEEQVELKAKEIDQLIMAPCCWTQPVSDHYSGVASEIRQGIRKMLAEGKTKDEVVQFYTGKYGERILSLPKAEGFNLMAYLLPAMALLAGAIVVRAIIRAWHQPATSVASSTATAAHTDEYARRREEELTARE